MRLLVALVGLFSLMTLTAVFAQPATDEEVCQIVEWTEAIQKSEHITPPSWAPRLPSSVETGAAAASGLSLATIDYARRVQAGYPDLVTRADVAGAEALIKTSNVQYYDTIGKLAVRYGHYETAAIARATARRLAETARAYLLGARREQDYVLNNTQRP